MHLTQPLHKALLQKPDATALICGERRQSFAAFVARVVRLASVLRELGVENGERVAMLGFNSDRYVEYLYATWWAGGVVNPVNARWSAREMATSLDDCDTRILLVDDPFLPLVSELRALSSSLETVLRFGASEHDARPRGIDDIEARMSTAAPLKDALRGGDDLAAIMYTGGTTGRPKGVMLTHANLYVSQLSSNFAAPRPDDAIGLNLAPLFHVGGLGLTLQLMMRLCTQVLVPAFDETTVLTLIERERASETFLVPTMLKRLIEDPQFAAHDLSSLELVLYGAAPIDETLLKAALARLPHTRFCQLYGMTELSPVVAVLPPWCHDPAQPAARLRAAGRPVPIAEVRIVAPDGTTAPTHAVGEIVARGPMTMAGYWNQPERTAEVLRDGWLHTGDAGYVDEDGFLYVVDRLKDMIVTGGENVYSAEVENAVAQLPQVALCAVIGVPDDQWGERVHAVIALRASETLDEQAVIAHCRTLIARYKCPRSVTFVDQLALSPSGKILKQPLREAYWATRERKVN
ncbi:long-chain fatty acid--CoA ligase [Paraburkholderia sp. J67]|uniref:acyl-CoA synthetase n=1 Tax=Paraburkholderia sp. J67 TaxID=2805435 RepID=UPI002ABD8A14|nr:long-chain fatty acid--CoA ligase [Paraburkholderia sp. J67]